MSDLLNRENKSSTQPLDSTQSHHLVKIPENSKGETSINPFNIAETITNENMNSKVTSSQDSAKLSDSILENYFPDLIFSENAEINKYVEKEIRSFGEGLQNLIQQVRDKEELKWKSMENQKSTQTTTEDKLQTLKIIGVTLTPPATPMEVIQMYTPTEHLVEIQTFQENLSKTIKEAENIINHLSGIITKLRNVGVNTKKDEEKITSLQSIICDLGNSIETKIDHEMMLWPNYKLNLYEPTRKPEDMQHQSEDSTEPDETQPVIMLNPKEVIGKMKTRNTSKSFQSTQSPDRASQYEVLSSSTHESEMSTNTESSPPPTPKQKNRKRPQVYSTTTSESDSSEISPLLKALNKMKKR